MVTTIEAVEEAERKAQEVFGPELQRHLKLSRAAQRLIGSAINKANDRAPFPTSQLVAYSLLARAFNDLRVIPSLATSGYGEHALSLAASTYEVCHCIAATCADSQLAEKWARQEDFTVHFEKIKNLTRISLAIWGHPEPAKLVDSEYKKYQMLCAAKHCKPPFRVARTYERRKGRVTVVTGPNVSDIGLRDAWLAIRLAVGFVTFTAIPSFAIEHVPQEAHLQLLEQATAIGTGLEELDKDAQIRWGDQPAAPEAE